MERKHYVRINLQLVRKPGLLAKAGERGGARAYLPVPGSRHHARLEQDRTPPSSTCASSHSASNCSNHFGLALIKGWAPSGCFFL